jgi:hypothetical protein
MPGTVCILMNVGREHASDPGGKRRAATRSTSKIEEHSNWPVGRSLNLVIFRKNAFFLRLNAMVCRQKAMVLRSNAFFVQTIAVFR